MISNKHKNIAIFLTVLMAGILSGQFAHLFLLGKIATLSLGWFIWILCLCWIPCGLVATLLLVRTYYLNLVEFWIHIAIGPLSFVFMFLLKFAR